MCNNKEEFPRPVTGCKADFDTVLDAQRFYTYVTSTDTARPTWLPPEVGWIPWGDPTIQNALLFRDMLPAGYPERAVSASAGLSAASRRS